MRPERTDSPVRADDAGQMERVPACQPRPPALLGPLCRVPSSSCARPTCPPRPWEAHGNLGRRENCVSPEGYVEVLTPVPPQVASFGNGVFTGVVKLR